MGNNKNILWVNYVKAICIICVFFVHSGLYYGLFTGAINIFIHPFYVNAFFFISGYLLFRKQCSVILLQENREDYLQGGGRTLANNILNRLVLPTLLFSLIEFLPSHILRGHGFDWAVFVYKTLGGCTYWFTAALVVAELVILLLLFTRNKNIWFYFGCSLIIFAIGQYLIDNDISLFDSYPSLPWQYKHGMLAILFLTFGGLYWRYESVINKHMNKYILFLLIILYMTALVVWPNDFRVLVSMLDINNLGIVISLLSTIILIEFCKLIPSSKLLNYIGKNTIGFYFMSGALPIVLSMAVHKFIPDCNYIGLIIVFISSVIFALIAVFLMNSFAPWVFDFRQLWKKS